MSTERRVLLRLTVFAIGAALIYLLRGALLPFIAGMAVAYLLDPVADRMERWGVPRWLAALLIVGAFIIAFVAVQVEADVKLLQPLRIDFRGRAHEQILRLLVHGERDDLANVTARRREA